MIEIDEFVKNQGVRHTRYVDDFRIFSNSLAQLKSVQQELTLYLYENHRLTLSGPKSEILVSKEFVAAKLHSPVEEETVELFQSVEVFNPYTEEIEEHEFPVEDEELKLKAVLDNMITKILGIEPLHLGLARTAIRKAKAYKLPDLVDHLISNIEFFAPVINDVVLYFFELSEEDQDALCPKLVAMLTSPALEMDIVKFWLEWYISGNATLLEHEELKAFVIDSPNFVHRARAAISMQDLAWVREHKTKLYDLGGWERRALLNAARVLPTDERDHWLKLTEASSPIVLDRWVAKWVRETA